MPFTKPFTKQDFDKLSKGNQRMIIKTLVEDTVNEMIESKIEVEYNFHNHQSFTILN